VEGDEPAFTRDLDMALISSPEPKATQRRYPIDLTLRSGDVEFLNVESEAELESWLSTLAAAAVSDAWPGGRGPGKKPQPLLYSMWALQHAETAFVVGPPGMATPGSAVGDAASLEAAAAQEKLVPSPFLRLPTINSVPTWQRKGLFLQKLRQCSIVFDGVDRDRFLGDREVKRNTLLEILDHCEGFLGDWRFLEDTSTMIRLNIFRCLPTPPPPAAGSDPEEEEEAFTDPQWPHLNIVYEILLKLVSSDALDLTLKKKVLDPPFVRSLLGLFDSEDARERTFLKTIAHRIYSKLTIRRALIRRVVCTVFYEFVLEGGTRNGVGAMLEILASIINGFTLPIKDEHKCTLVRALIPLHKPSALALYHTQLTFCMALYVSKDHTLTRVVVEGLIKYWPNGAASKQIMFLNELEDIFEHVQVSV